ncbi:hypothetical protein B0T20DRAFT_478059 [Sordaria brevicollis]|uniref:Uncharacterized protein n=1 Tax=Sordaria brevicollis TaxID=83679 RepID=A0AAE0PI33_SORBR|nr:hypothetical protein B0T20DRAFT_478059 [Sordaria brevicollis]
MPAPTKLVPLRRAASTRFEFRDDDSDSDDLGQHPSSGPHPVTGLGISLKSGGPTPPPEAGESGYETVPVQPPPRNPRRLTVQQQKQTFRPTSSVYSENSPPLAPHDPEQPSTVASHHFQRYRGGEEISPPSSPEPSYTQPHHHRPPILPPGDVSPIEEEYEETAQGAFDPQPYGRHQQQHPYHQGPGPRSPPPNHNGAANINMMRRGQHKLSDAALRDSHVNRAPPPQQYRNPGPGFPLFDPVTGERLDSAHGRPLNRPPPGGPYGPAPGLARQQSPPPYAGQQPRMASVGDRMMRMTSPGPRENGPDPAAGGFMANRPGWRGPSGRTAIVDPVHDNPAVPPLRIPDRNGRRVVSQAAGPSQRPELSLGIPRRDQMSPPPRIGAQMGYGPRDPGQRIVSASQVHPQSATTSRPVRSPVYPNAPHSAITPRGDAPFVASQQLQRDGMGHPPPRAFSPVSPTTASSVNYSPQPNSVRRKPTPTYANHQPQDSISSVYSQQQPEVSMPKQQQPPAAQPASATNPLPADEPWVQPPSRFSVTTYATSISTTATPRESLDDFHHNSPNPPPVPSIPPQHRPESSPKEEEPAPSIMNRSRPKLEGFDYNKKDQAPIKVSLKDQIISPYETVVERESPAARDRRVAATGSGTNGYGSKPTSSQGTRRVSATPSDINKSLPPAPPELEALSIHNGDGNGGHKSPKEMTASERVALYDAQIQALGNRRINITRSIKQMTELMPTDNILNSEAVRRKREIEKQKVEALKLELAEVQREMYELGLKLHRAYKRQEKEASFEPTTFTQSNPHTSRTLPQEKSNKMCTNHIYLTICRSCHARHGGTRTTKEKCGEYYSRRCGSTDTVQHARYSSCYSCQNRGDRGGGGRDYSYGGGRY